MVEYAINPLDDRAAFLAEWTALYPQSLTASFFQSPSWVKAWLDGAPTNSRLYRVEAKDAGRRKLLGVFCHAPRRPPLLGLGEWWFQEYGDAGRDAVYGEYADFLISEDAPPNARAEALCAMIDAAPDGDGFVFRNLQPAMAEAVRAAASMRGLTIRVLREQPVYTWDLLREPFAARFSRSLQSKIARAVRLYEERGALEYRIVRSAADWPEVWMRLVALHGAGWAARGEKSAFDNTHLVEFHERLRSNAPEALHLFEVTAGGVVLAVLYNFIHGKRVMNYQSGFVREDDNRLTPGFVAHTLAAKHYRELGFETYDLLAGEADYKARLGAVEATLTSLVAERPTWRNRLRTIVRG